MPNNNDVNNLIFNQMGCFLSGAKFVSAFIGNAGSGDIDIYTCPSGKRASVSWIIAFNSAGTSTTCQAEINVSGTYYKIDASSGSILTLTLKTLMQSNSAIILEAAEKIAVNTSQAGMNIWANILEFDSTSPLKTSKVLSLSNGDNTLYTCPASKTAITIDAVLTTNSGFNNINYYNGSGLSRSIKYNVVLSGGSVASTNQYLSTNVSNGTTYGTGGACIILNAGDFVNFNTNSGTTTQTGWINILEF